MPNPLFMSCPFFDFLPKVLNRATSLKVTNESKRCLLVSLRVDLYLFSVLVDLWRLGPCSEMFLLDQMPKRNEERTKLGGCQLLRNN